MSLARTAMLWLTLVLFALGLAAFAIAYELAAREAAGFLDNQLRQLALNVSVERVQRNAPFVKHDPEDEFVIEIWDDNGATLRQPAHNQGLPRLTKPGLTTLHAHGEKWRVYLAVEGSRHIEVGQRIAVRQEMAQTAAWQAGGPVLIVIPLAWLVILWSVGQWSRRLNGLAREIGGRGAGNTAHIPLAEVPVEIKPFVEAINQLTARLEASLTAQKRFVADAAHELRTPLSAVQLQIDNLASSKSVGEPQIKALRGGVQRATILVEQLLRLARMENGVTVQQKQRVDVSACLMQSVADHIAAAAVKGVDLGIQQLAPVTVFADITDLQMLFDNLIDNAIRYTPKGGTIDASILRNGEGFTVDIVDTGCGVNAADISRLCDRFFRAAAPDVAGNGLGLAIAAAAAGRNNLALTFANRTDRQGLWVRVRSANLQPGRDI
ncbi:MAG: two-component sensor histidine kinase [Hyphomicrobiales bacterium]|nr:two-component sensor histidine kinase [Hyphomicrobiales bacterium]MDE2115020.1 two-component sensor histidine kinase [Hyphomicrobiales bacterium]